ncbi:MAG: type II toxin-antitoxin system Phd/YefM family antitoxin [Nitrospirae bacterium]|nr:type II toxin-antitoxin system Phd/YefM family antitoxin [Nitrospirota bacterium]
MTRTMPIIEARKKLTSLPEEFEQGDEAKVIAVTRRGKPVLAVLPWELYETVAETLEVLGNEKLMKDLRSSIKEMQAGRLISWDKAKKQLGL